MIFLVWHVTCHYVHLSARPSKCHEDLFHGQYLHIFFCRLLLPCLHFTFVHVFFSDVYAYFFTSLFFRHIYNKTWKVINIFRYLFGCQCGCVCEIQCLVVYLETSSVYFFSLFVSHLLSGSFVGLTIIIIIIIRLSMTCFMIRQAPPLAAFHS